MVPGGQTTSCFQLIRGVRNERVSSGQRVRSSPEFPKKQRQKALIKSSCAWPSHAIHLTASWQCALHTFDSNPFPTPVCAVIIWGHTSHSPWLLFNFQVKDFNFGFHFSLLLRNSLILGNFSDPVSGKGANAAEGSEKDLCLKVTKRGGEKWILGTALHWKISWRPEQMPRKVKGCIKTPFYESSCAFSFVP